MQKSLFSQEHLLLLARIDAAIARVLAAEQTPICVQAITNLRMKRVLVESGNYSIRQVNEEAIAAVGREIGIMTKNTGLRNPLVGKNRNR